MEWIPLPNASIHFLLSKPMGQNEKLLVHLLDHISPWQGSLEKPLCAREGLELGLLGRYD